MKKIENSYLISALGVVGIALVAANFSGPSLFNNTGNFVLFAQEEIKLEQETQVSSGDISSNKTLTIEKDSIINGNLFADTITIDKNTSINGNASYNTLNLHKDSQVLGTQTKPVHLPIANLPEVPDFQTGTEDFNFTGEANTLSAGSYKDITLENNSRLILTGGIYNLRTLELKDGAVLIFNASTTMNIKFKLRGHDKVSILPGLNTPHDALSINYLGIKSKNDTKNEDDDNELESEMDEQEKKDHKAGKIGRLILFGNRSFLNFKLTASKAKVVIGKESVVRGQILAQKIKIEKGAVLSREEFFSKDTDTDKIITVEGEKFPVNEIVLVLRDGAAFADAQAIASLVNGRITGFIDIPQIYKIEVSVSTQTELDNLVAMVEAQNNLLVLFVSRNSLGALK